MRWMRLYALLLAGSTRDGPRDRQSEGIEGVLPAAMTAPPAPVSSLTCGVHTFWSLWMCLEEEVIG